MKIYKINKVLFSHTNQFNFFLLVFIDSLPITQVGVSVERALTTLNSKITRGDLAELDSLEINILYEITHVERYAGGVIIASRYSQFQPNLLPPLENSKDCAPESATILLRLHNLGLKADVLLSLKEDPHNQYGFFVRARTSSTHRLIEFVEMW